jgi:drug/metabolite transporter (DMT)-like permease
VSRRAQHRYRRPVFRPPAPVRAAAPQDLAAIAICSLIWGTTWFVITLQLGVVPTAVSIVYRFALAALLLFGWLAATRQPIRLTSAQHVAVFGQGLFTFALDYSFVYLAEERVNSAVVAVMFAGLAFANLVLFRALLGQKAGRGAWIGAALGVVGVAVMSGAELLRTEMNPRVATGLVLALVGVGTAAVGNLCAWKGQKAGAPLGAQTAWAMGYGAALVTGYVLVSGTPWRIELTPEYLGSLLYLSVVGSVISFLVYFGLARRRGYTLASYIGALTPPTAMLVSVVFEGARFGLAAFAGLALVLFGQLLLIRSNSG